MATIKEIADVAGVSSTTVSRVLNNDPNLLVSDETREKVIQMANQLGYRKKKINYQIKNVAFLYWIPEQEELDDIYYKQIKLELEKQADANGILMDRYDRSDGIDAVDKNTQAIIAMGRFSEEELARMKNITSHVIFVDTPVNENSFDFVQPNLSLMIFQMVDYFMEQGHRNIGFIGAKALEDFFKIKYCSRERAFCDITKEYNIYNEANIFIANNHSVNDGYHIALQAIEKLGENMPTAFCVENDPLAIGVLQAFNEKGWLIPQRVSFFSINDISVAKYVSPPLTTFNINIPLICETTFDLLRERLLKHRTTAKTVFIDGTPMFRKST